MTSEPTGGGDEIEKIAMLASRCIAPFSGCAFSARRTDEAHEKAPPLCAAHIADHPLIADPFSVRQVTPAHVNGAFGEPTHDFSALFAHLGLQRKRPAGMAGLTR